MISVRFVADAGGYSGTPLQMYEPHDVYVKTGDEARLFCEAFVGKYTQTHTEFAAYSFRFSSDRMTHPSVSNFLPAV